MMFDENPENIFIYHYVEEMISSYGEYYKSNFKEVELTLNEFSILLRIRFQGVATQYDLVNLFKVSGAYIAKLLRKFEDMGYVARKENPRFRMTGLVFDWESTEGQLRFLKYEIESDASFTAMLSNMRSYPNDPRGAYQAAYDFCITFERPSEAEQKAAQRGQNAENIFFPMFVEGDSSAFMSLQ